VRDRGCRRVGGLADPWGGASSSESGQAEQLATRRSPYALRCRPTVPKLATPPFDPPARSRLPSASAERATRAGVEAGPRLTRRRGGDAVAPRARQHRASWRPGHPATALRAAPRLTAIVDRSTRRFPQRSSALSDRRQDAHERDHGPARQPRRSRAIPPGARRGPRPRPRPH